MDFDIKKLHQEMQGRFDSYDASALIHVAPLAEEFRKDAEGAIEKIVRVYNQALDEAYTDEDGKKWRAFIESFAGGPSPEIPTAVYNTVGTFYPYFSRDLKDKSLGGVLNILDRLNTRIIQDIHTPRIREPLLFSDIVICRPPYSPGLDEGKAILANTSSFNEFKQGFMDEKGFFLQKRVLSDFCVASAVLRSDMSDFGEEYARTASSAFLNRVIKGIVGIYFSKRTDPKDIAKEREDFRRILPKTTHEIIDSAIEKADWVDYKKFS